MAEIKNVGKLSMDQAVEAVRHRMDVRGQDWLDACYATFCSEKAGISSGHSDEWVALLEATRRPQVVV